MKSNIKKMRVRICFLGLTARDIPDALKIADIVVVEGNDATGPYCLIAVSASWVWEAIARKTGLLWRQDQQVARFYGAVAFSEVDKTRARVLSELEVLFGEPNYVFDEHSFSENDVVTILRNSVPFNHRNRS